jgi:hypothetical protein
MNNFQSYGKHKTLNQDSLYVIQRNIIKFAWNAPCIARGDDKTSYRLAINKAYKHQVADYSDYIRFLKQKNVRYSYIP